MKTLRRISQGLDSIPTATAWYLADLGRAMGKQELFTRQSPQLLKRLRGEGRVECLGRGQHARWQKTPRRK